MVMLMVMLMVLVLVWDLSCPGLHLKIGLRRCLVVHRNMDYDATLEFWGWYSS